MLEAPTPVEGRSLAVTTARIVQATATLEHQGVKGVRQRVKRASTCQRTRSHARRAHSSGTQFQASGGVAIGDESSDV